MITLFHDPTGLKLTYSDGLMYVSDPNLELETHWRMNRWDMLKLGVRCFKAAVYTGGPTADELKPNKRGT